MYKSQLQTTNFNFVAYGQTESDSLATLLRGLVKHGEQYGIEPSWFAEIASDIYTIKVDLNVAYRDNEQIKG